MIDLGFNPTDARQYKIVAETVHDDGMVDIAKTDSEATQYVVFDQHSWIPKGIFKSRVDAEQFIYLGLEGGYND